MLGTDKSRDLSCVAIRASQQIIPSQFRFMTRTLVIVSASAVVFYGSDTYISLQLCKMTDARTRVHRTYVLRVLMCYAMSFAMIDICHCARELSDQPSFCRSQTPETGVQKIEDQLFVAYVSCPSFFLLNRMSKRVSRMMTLSCAHGESSISLFLESRTLFNYQIHRNTTICCHCVISKLYLQHEVRHTQILKERIFTQQQGSPCRSSPRQISATIDRPNPHSPPPTSPSSSPPPSFLLSGIPVTLSLSAQSFNTTPQLPTPLLL
jgi:hypothetical protein